MKISYIFRKRLKQYNSIEELFYTIKEEVSKKYTTQTIELPYSGASLNVLYKNMTRFIRPKSSVAHITGDVHYMGLLTRGKSVLTIHDVDSARKGSFLKKLYINMFWFWLPALCVSRITVISEFTKQQLSKIIPFAKHKIRVIYNPVNPLLAFSPKDFETKKPVILFVGTKSNKNLERSFKAIEGISCKALIIGSLSEAQINLLKTHEIEYENKVNLSFIQVVDCYKNCDIVCFASVYEGFGMPIIEAQTVGRPVITSDIGAMKEIADNSACLVNPYDVDAIKKGLLKIIENTTYREKLVASGLENIKRFQPSFFWYSMSAIDF